MKITDLKETKYLTKEAVTPSILVTIADCRKENLAMEGQAAEMKSVLFFAEPNVKPMVLNPVNIDLLGMIHPAQDTDEWRGKKVVLFNDPTIAFKGKVVGGIRIRAVKKAATAVPAAAPAPADDEAGEDVPY